jgi:G patch domain-containing protein 1
MDSDSEDFVVIGTSFERESKSQSYRQKVKPLATTKALPAHLQVPTDAEGRRRFHGAFEGGFSAGYHNTVGSKEGWTPSEFRSTRTDRASQDAHLNKAETYMDDDEREALLANMLQATDDFDTFGEGARRKAQRQHASAAGPDRNTGGGGLIPGPVPTDLVVAKASPAAVRLLRLMGWRPGKGVGRKQTGRNRGEGGEERVNTLGNTSVERESSAVETGNASLERDSSAVEADDTPSERLELLDDTLVPVSVTPKLNRHGVGYDPFLGAEEFRKVAALRKKRLDADPRGMQSSVQTSRGDAFGVGVFEESDPEDEPGNRGDEVGHFFEMPDSDSGSDDGHEVNANASRAVAARLGSSRGSLRVTNDAPTQKTPGGDSSGRNRTSAGIEPIAVNGFVLSKHTLAPSNWYAAPDVPLLFDRRHVFPDENCAPAPPTTRLQKSLEKSLERKPGFGQAPGSGLGGVPVEKQPSVPPPPPPRDQETRKFIDTTSFFVAKNGEWFEQMVREKQKDEGKFSFLRNGDGAAYYKWRLGKAKDEIEKNTGDASVWANSHRSVEQQSTRARPLDADDRAKALGETQLKVTQPSSQKTPNFINVGGIATGDASKLRLALSSAFTSGSVEGGAGGTDPGQALPAGLTAASSLAARNEVARAKAAACEAAEQLQRKERELKQPMRSIRTAQDWAPASLLCKRFAIGDPFEYGDGRVRPATVKTTFRSENVELTETNQKAEAERPKFLNVNKADDKTHAEINKPSDTSDDVVSHPQSDDVVPPQISDEAENFLQGLFFKKTIFEDSDDEAEAELRADREDLRRVEVPPPPPPRPHTNTSHLPCLPIQYTQTADTENVRHETPNHRIPQERGFRNDPLVPPPATLKRARQEESVLLGDPDLPPVPRVANTPALFGRPPEFESGKDKEPKESSKNKRKEKKREKKKEKKAQRREKKAEKKAKKRRRKDAGDSSSDSDSSESDE